MKWNLFSPFFNFRNEFLKDASNWKKVRRLSVKPVISHLRARVLCSHPHTGRVLQGEMDSGREVGKCKDMQD